MASSDAAAGGRGAEGGFVASHRHQHEPWHLQLSRELRRTGDAARYPEIAAHGELFSGEGLDRWLVPEFREALSAWRQTSSTAALDIASLPGVKLEAPGVISFECLTPEFCDMLMDEVKNYQASGLPQRAPNSMNNYGLVLNEVGMRPFFTAFLEGYLRVIGARLFGNDEDRAGTVGDEALGTDDWGGSSLSSHHSFVVQYSPDRDRHLDMHVDECDVTFNFGLTDTGSFEGSDLAFCGMVSSPEHRRHTLTYKHVKGRCVIHSGKQRHGALNITAGERASLIMWTKSEQFRRTPAYAAKVREIPRKIDAGAPDTVCLSYTHDLDYSSWASTSHIKVVVRGKLPSGDTEISVEPHFTVGDVAEVLCYGTSRRGGSWHDYRAHGGTPPLASLMRFSCKGHPQLEFIKTLEAYGVGDGDLLNYAARVVRTSVVFCKAWDQLNGEPVYFSQRYALSNNAVTGLDLRHFAYRLMASERKHTPWLADLRLFCVQSGASIDDTSSVSELFGRGECLLCVRIELTKWARCRPVFLVVEKGAPLVTHGGSFKMAIELKLLLFLQLHRKDYVFRRIVSFL